MTVVGSELCSCNIGYSEAAPDRLGAICRPNNETRNAARAGDRSRLVVASSTAPNTWA